MSRGSKFTLAFLMVLLTTISTVQAQTPSLSAGTGFGQTGDTVSVALTLTNPTASAIGGLQFAVVLGDTTKARFLSLADSVSGYGFTSLAVTRKDTTYILLYSTGNDSIPTGVRTLGSLSYVLLGASGTQSTLGLTIQRVGDQAGNAVTTTAQNGAVQIGLRGDLNNDQAIDVLDIILVARILVDRDPTPAVGTAAFAIADVNRDGAINVTDIIALVNRILGLAKVVANGPTAPVALTFGETLTLPNGQLAIPVLLGANGMIAGAQMAITFDPALLTFGTPQLTGRATALSLDSHVVGNTLRVVVFSLLPGQGIAAGQGPVLLIPVVLKDAAISPTLTLTDVVLANTQAQVVPVVPGGNSARVQALPAAFALKSNRPNPFNPATQIAYEVPQQAHITLMVYNLLGQEVVTLVNEVQAAGRYTVTWNGRNTEGTGVASGVYLYRMISSTGYSETRRMTLLK